MSNLGVTRFRALDANGDPISGAKLHTWITDTETDKTSYPTEADMLAGTSPNANPVVADGDGWFPAIYLIPNEQYTLKLTDASDVEIWTENKYNAPALSSAGAESILASLVSDPITQGAVGDGVANDAVAVQAAIDAGVRVVDLLGKTYKVNSQLTVPAGIVIRNGTLDGASYDGTAFIAITGSIDGAVFLTSDATRHKVTLTDTNTPALQVGDLVAISQADKWGVPAGTNTGELAEVASVTATAFEVRRSLRNDYTTANSAQYQKITSIDNVGFEDVTFLTSSIDDDEETIQIQWGRNIHFDRCTFSGIDEAGIGLYQSFNVRVTSCTFIGGVSDNEVGIQLPASSERVTIKDCFFKDLDKGIVSNYVAAPGSYGPGQVRSLHVERCSFETLGEAIAIGENASHVRLRDLTVYARDENSAAQIVKLDCVNLDVNGLEVHGAAAGDYIKLNTVVPDITNQQFSVSLNNVRSLGDDTKITLDITPAAPTSGAGLLNTLSLRNIELDGDLDINLGSSADYPTYDRILLENISLHESGILTVDSAHSTVTVAQLTLSNINADKTTVTGTSESISYLTVNGYYPDGLGSTVDRVLAVVSCGYVHLERIRILGELTTTHEAIYVSDCSWVQLSDVLCRLSTSTEYLIALENIVNIVLTNVISDALIGSGIKIEASGTELESLVVNGGQYRGSEIGFLLKPFTSDMANVVISGAYFYTSGGANDVPFQVDPGAGLGLTGLNIAGSTFNRDNTSDVCLDMNTGETITQVLIDGCSFYNGNSAIVASSGLSSYRIGDNYYVGQSASRLFGCADKNIYNTSTAQSAGGSDAATQLAAGEATIPANYLHAGDTIRFAGAVEFFNNSSGEDLIFSLRLYDDGSVVIIGQITFSALLNYGAVIFEGTITVQAPSVAADISYVTRIASATDGSSMINTPTAVANDSFEFDDALSGMNSTNEIHIRLYEEWVSASAQHFHRIINFAVWREG